MGRVRCGHPITSLAHTGESRAQANNRPKVIEWVSV